jgi:tetratricopeptide (TPR) repeat protein
MADPHLTFDLLSATEEGLLTQESLFELYVLHLRTLCARCDVALQEYLDELEDEAAAAAGLDPDELPPRRLDALRDPDLSDEERIEAFLAAPRFRRFPEKVLDGIRRTLVAVTVRLDEEETQAETERRELVRLVDAGRGEEAVGRVERARTRFRTLALGHALLREVRRSLPDRPARALPLARAAERVAWRLDRENPALHTLRGSVAARAQAHQGNALRALDRLAEADRAFAHARDTLREFQVAEPEVLAEIDALEGSLRRDQRRFGESERLLRRAAAQYAAAEDALGLGRALLKLGSLCFHAGRAEEALAHAEAAHRTLPAGAPPRLRLCAEHNRIDYLCDLGHFDVAADLLAEARPLYEERDDAWTRCRLAWVEGKVAHGLGDADRAREKLEAARGGFRAAEAAYDTALVSLELAELHLEAGRTSQARALARETVALFRALDISREAEMALAQLRRAVEEAGRSVDQAAALTVALLRATARALRRG